MSRVLSLQLLGIQLTLVAGFLHIIFVVPYQGSTTDGVVILPFAILGTLLTVGGSIMAFRE